MAGVGIEVELQGFGALQAKLQQLALTDYEPVLDQIGATVAEQTLERFEQERDPEGRPWRPLHADTVLRKLGGSRRAYKKRGGLKKAARRKLGAMKILQDSSWQGGLISTIHHQVRKDEVIIGTGKVYGATHQFGRGAIPARPFLGLSTENEAEVEAVVEEWMKQQLKP